ncbi:MAG: hypothetical protein LM581_06160 [Desulfurococcales archaeon]|nr:hypothetical protein [Desulfurococcales archaeon]
MRFLNRRFLSTILAILLIISLFIYLNDIHIPLSATLVLNKQIIFNVSSKDLLNISIYRIYISEPDERIVNITFLVEPNKDIFTITVRKERDVSELKEAGYIYYYISNQMKDLVIYVIDPYLNNKVLVGVYRGYSFDSYVQTSLYTAYIVVDKLFETNIRCLKDFSGHVFIEGLTKKNEIINKEIGSCDIERQEITYIISDLKNYRVYILSKDPYNIFNLRFYNDGSIYLSPRDNTPFLIAIQGMFITSLILLNMPAYIKNRSYRKRVRKRKI